MKVKLAEDKALNIGGVDLTLPKGTNVELNCETEDHAAELCHLLRLPVDLSHMEGKVMVTYGAAGNRIETRPEVKEEKKEVEKKAEPAKAEKPKAEKPKKEVRAKAEKKAPKKK